MHAQPSGLQAGDVDIEVADRPIGVGEQRLHTLNQRQVALRAVAKFEQLLAARAPLPQLHGELGG